MSNKQAALILAGVVVIGVLAIAAHPKQNSAGPGMQNYTQPLSILEKDRDEKANLNWKEGDQMGDFSLTSLKKKYDSDGVIYAIYADFTGTTIVSGNYHYNEDYEWWEFAVSKEDAAKIPMLPFDNREPWFCFRNKPDELAKLFPEQKGAARIVVKDYSLTYTGKSGCGLSMALVSVSPL